MNQPAMTLSRRLNRWQSRLLLLAMSCLLALIGWLLAGAFAALAAFATVLFGYVLNARLSPHTLMRLHRARPLARSDAPSLYPAVEEIARRAGLPRPPVLYFLPSPVPNAIAMGEPDNSAIALSGGLLHKLSWQPLLGVIGHEISHIRHQDLQLLTFAELVGRLTSYLALGGLAVVAISLPLVLFTELRLNWLALALLIAAPLLCRRLHLALSRTREFEADRGSAELLGSPQPLIEALQRLEDRPDDLLHRLFMPHRRRTRPADVGTHPSTEQRIERLRSLDGRPLPPPATVLLQTRGWQDPWG